MTTSTALGIFDTLVPVASISTIAVILLLTLPHRQEKLGCFFLIWWTLSIAISLNDTDVLFQSSSHWSPGDWKGLLVLLGVPLSALGGLYIWIFGLSSSSSTTLRFFCYRNVPLWCLVALHSYRIDGLSILYPFWNGKIPKYFGFQLILLDVLIGITSIPLSIFIYMRGVDFVRFGWKRDVFWFWNSLGLYDLVSAYGILLLNFVQIGGPLVTDPALSTLGLHPIPLIVLFQAPLAIGIHIFLLTSLEPIVDRQSTVLPLIRVQQSQRRR